MTPGHDDIEVATSEEEYGITGEIFEDEHFDYWREPSMKRRLLKCVCV